MHLVLEVCSAFMVQVISSFVQSIHFRIMLINNINIEQRVRMNIMYVITLFCQLWRKLFEIPKYFNGHYWEGGTDILMTPKCASQLDHLTHRGQNMKQLWIIEFPKFKWLNCVMKILRLTTSIDKVVYNIYWKYKINKKNFNPMY